MIQALIFDFDGLILDTEMPEFQAWCDVFTAHKCQLSLTNWLACIGTAADAFDPYADLERQLGRPMDRDTLRTHYRQRRDALLAPQQVLPGVQECLHEAVRLGLRLGVASSSSRAWVTGHLTRLGLLRHFAAIRCADDVRAVKPNPASYLAVLEALETSPDRAMAFEDSSHGVLAAKRAGLFCVAVPNALTRHLSLAHADLCITSLAAHRLETLLTLATATNHGKRKCDASTDPDWASHGRSRPQ